MESRTETTVWPPREGRRWLQRVPALVRAEPALFCLVAASVIGYSLYSVWEHTHFLTDFDLAIADQAVWHYSHFTSPEITTIVPPVSVLGDHFSPLTALLAPLYWAWSDPRMLLIAQAVLIAASIVPVFLFARPRLGRVGAYLACGGYALFWGINAAVGYQWHDLCFSPLLIALCILFADRKQWTAYFISIAALLLVKENLSLVVVFIGLWLVSGREYRLGAITAGVGVIWYFLALNVLLPAFAGDAGYTHWTYTDFGPDGPSALVKIITHPDLPVRELFNNSTKTQTLALLFIPFLGLVFCSRLVILVIPLVAQQLFSSYPAQWGTEFHYWLPIAPVLAMGAADGFRNLASRIDGDQGRRVALAGGLVGAFILCANLTLSVKESWVGSAYDAQVTGIPLFSPLRPGFSLAATADDRAAEGAIAAIPNGVSVTAAAPVLPHLSERNDIYLLGYVSPANQYVVFRPAGLGWPDPAYERQWLDQHRSEYRPIYDRGGWVVWRHT